LSRSPYSRLKLRIPHAQLVQRTGWWWRGGPGGIGSRPARWWDGLASEPGQDACQGADLDTHV
jgi:hypothetical protein